MTLADRIVVLNHGRIEQVGTPQELYHTPDNRFVASFIGSPRMNFLAVSPKTGTDAGTIVGPGNLTIAMVANNPAGPIAEIGIRPEGLRLVGANEGRITCTLERVEDLGHEHFAYCRITDDTVWVIRVAKAPAPDLIGRPVGLDFTDTALFAFTADGNRVLLSPPAAGLSEANEP